MENSKVIMSRAIMPSMTNASGIAFGGQLMAWMDEVAGIAAARFTQGNVIMASVKDVNFKGPIPLGAFIDIIGEVEKVGNTSLQIGISIMMDDRNEEGIMEQVKAVDAIFIAVHIDEEGKAIKIKK